MKKEFFSLKENIPRHENERIKELFNNLEKIKEEFESIQRPKLQMETPKIKDVLTPRAWSLIGKSPKFDHNDRSSSEGYTPMHVESSPENSPPITPNLAAKSIERSNMDLNSSSQTKAKQSSSNKNESNDRSKAENENPTQMVTTPSKESPSQAKHDEVSRSTAAKEENKSEPEANLSKLGPELEKDSNEGTKEVAL